MELPVEVAALLSIECRKVRRAALDGLYPGLSSLADSVVGDPSRIEMVGAEWVEALLACLDAEDATSVALAYGDVEVGRALARVHGQHVAGCKLAGLPAGSVGAQQLRTWVGSGTVTVADAAAYARRCGQAHVGLAVLAGVFVHEDGSRAPRRPDELEVAAELFSEMFCGTDERQWHTEDAAWAYLWEILPPGTWDRPEGMTAYTAQVLWEGPLAGRDVAQVLDRAPMTDEAAAFVLGRLADLPPGATVFADQLVMVDRAVAHTGGPVPVLSLQADAVLEVVGVLGDGALREHVVGALVEGRYGSVQSVEQFPRLGAMGLSPHEVVSLVSPWLLGEWISVTDPQGWGELLAGADIEAVDAAVGSAVWADDPAGRARFVALAVEHTPKLLSVLGDFGERELVDGVVAHLVEALGDDPMAWLALWQLAPRWPGTVDEAVECIRACQS